MSFVTNSLLSGGARLHVERGDSEGKNGVKRTSQGPSGLLAPLIQLVKNPFGVIGGGEAPQESQTNTEEEDRRQLLYLRMKDADTYDSWKAAATELDTLEGNDAWKLEDESTEYDAELLKTRLEQLDEARLNCDVKRMLFLVRTTLTRGLGGMGELRLYKHAHVGTKKLIERYIDSTVQTLAALPEVAAKQGDSCSVKTYAVMEELLRTRQSYGRTALLLSGGGTFGMKHIGVVKCLWELRLLPRIVSGASAGSIVCAILCSKTDDEMPAILHEFCYGDLAVFEASGKAEGVMEKVARFLKYGSLYDITHLERVMKKMIGDITFQESYNRTRRILNITVSSASMYELPRLLNYVTAPDVKIWSAVCASCSVPLVFSAASLIAKDPKTGKEVPWNPTPTEGWIDGSVDNDLPMTRLAEMFNVNHFIVSQVNPHVVPFLGKEEDAIGTEVQSDSAISASPGWMHNITAFAKGEALHRLDLLAEMGVFPNTIMKTRSILNQRYSGDITIFPQVSYANIPKILSNPTTEYMLRSMLTGEQATWPKIARVRNQVAVELALDDAVNKILPVIHFSSSQSNLRQLNLPGSSPQKDGPAAHRRRRMNRSVNHAAYPTPLVQITSPTFSRRFSPGIKTAAHSSKPFLRTHPSRIGTRSLDITNPNFATIEVISSTDQEGSSSGADLSGNDESDTSDLLSSPSPPRSPPRLPELWPSTRQFVFPSLSNPSTPNTPVPGSRHRSRSSVNLEVPQPGQPGVPSSPELRYKRLFHPPPPPTPPMGAPRPSVPQELQRPVQPLTRMPSMENMSSVPEEEVLRNEQFPPAELFQTDSLDDYNVLPLGSPAYSPAYSPGFSPRFSPAQSPRGSRSRSSSLQKICEQHQLETEEEKATKEGLGLQFDYSGTRGMMLRKKRSRSGSNALNLAS